MTGDPHRVRDRLRAALTPAPSDIEIVADRRERRAIIVELILVGTLTFGFSAASAILALVESQLTGGVGQTTVALNPVTSPIGGIDLIRQSMSVTKLCAFGGIALYLLWRSGIGPARIGLHRPSRADVPPSVILAAVIGLPGLALVAVAEALGWNAQLIAAAPDGLWWRLPVLVLKAFANGFAEEIVVVGYLLTRLRQLGVSTTGALWSSALLRGTYHLYQGFAAGIGNIAMGMIYARWYQVTRRLWPLVIAHALIDTVAFGGYAILAAAGALD